MHIYDQELLAHLQSQFVGRYASARDVWLVLEGDCGGQVYLTVPWVLVGTRARISCALRFLDRLAWDCNDDFGADAMLWDLADVGGKAEYGIPAGMGGGLLLPGLWLHEEFSSRQRLLVCSLLDLPGSRPLPIRA